MNFFYSDKYKKCVSNKFCNNYIIYGNNIFLKENSILNILKLANKFNFNNTIRIMVDNTFKFEMISNFIKENDLFIKKKTIILTVIKQYHKILFKNINRLINLLNKNIFLIIKSDKLDKIDYFLIKKTKIQVNLINCNTPIGIYLHKWIKKRIKELKFNLNYKIIKLLCYYYEGNILALNQILKIISLISLTKSLNILNIKKIIFDQALFHPSQWSESLLYGNYTRSIHILKQLFKNKYSPITLIRFLQNDLLILIIIKRFKQNIKEILSINNYYIYNIRKLFFNKIINLLDNKKIYLILKFLIKIELMIHKENNEKIVWLHLKILSTF
ncbi:DNA polymerase III subunit delta [Candidatus Purcelliella pentastirinorum]|uniref:DNA polymerase III subunit delta n=1 Tax=Candidatus Purcelliella pentastirinorum TaxID=472834 RepID=UPI002368CD9B|nr:DNA polymerase III subunit delta [Candidatus Purcelliella pentastirinorum]WDI78982.1 DNA polymerase III subunit delta [Candidatus Purcelliella pentastirinorum]WDR80118.1 DNA polymerase III subunit delta [Candidatus Purcelliella pentastirinorum]